MTTDKNEPALPAVGLPLDAGVVRLETERADAGTDWPCARLTVDESGFAQRAVLYSPGLPPGDHDVWCLPVEAAAELEHLRAQCDMWRDLAEMAIGVAERGERAAEIRTRYDALTSETLK